MLLHLIAVALFVGSIAVPVCPLRFAYRFVKKARNPAIASGEQLMVPAPPSALSGHVSTAGVAFLNALRIR